jgi:hypothetical protein
MSLLRSAIILILAGGATSALADQITCESHRSSGAEPCGTVAAGSTVRLVRQLSHASCIEGRTWGTGPDNDSIWVSGGCRAVFDVQSPNGGSAPQLSAGEPQYRNGDDNPSDQSPEWQRGFDDGQRGTFDRRANSSDYRLGYRAGKTAAQNDDQDDRYARAPSPPPSQYRDERAPPDRDDDAQNAPPNYGDEGQPPEDNRGDDRNGGRQYARADRRNNARQACVDQAAVGQRFGPDQISASEARWIGHGLLSVDLDTPTGPVECTVDGDGKVRSLENER